MNEVLVHTAPWMKVKGILLREVSQTQKASIFLYLSSSIFALYSSSSTHLKRKMKEKGYGEYLRKKEGKQNSEAEEEVQERGLICLSHGFKELFSFISLE